MKFEQNISHEDVEGVTHNPDGDVIQTHELASGELLITFDPDWATQNGWLIDDTIVFEITDAGLNIINKSKNDRDAAFEFVMGSE